VSTKILSPQLSRCRRQSSGLPVGRLLRKRATPLFLNGLQSQFPVSPQSNRARIDQFRVSQHKVLGPTHTCRHPLCHWTWMAYSRCSAWKEWLDWI